MNKKPFLPACMNMRGVTLAELIISTIIISIVLIGVSTVNVAVRRMGRETEQDATAQVALTGMAEIVRQSALHAVGAATDPGIIINSDPSTNYVCFRIKMPGTWECYSVFQKSAGARTELYKGEELAPQPAQTAPLLYLGSITPDSLLAPGRVPIFNAGGNHFFEMELVTRAHPESNADRDIHGNPTRGTQDNPQVSVKLRVYPEAHSF
ncbi:MAG: hypothetical protein HQL19_03195 [Candidatus Omnitrophica bacterium]|nr:hypothetical protein [Candidatus Omnitrophota bacterium]